jgi:enoyl-CoA hydratase/carnithine racemase
MLLDYYEYFAMVITRLFSLVVAPEIVFRYFLSRLAGGLGMYAALTGARLRAADCLYAGVATHFMSSARVPELLV